MRRALRRAGWSLIAAGTLRLAGQAAAQETLPQAEHPRGAPVLPNRPAVLSEGELFLEQVHVELAWMADPVTFPYGIAAYCSGQALQIRGYVPTDVIREHAVRIARQHTRLPVWEDLRVYPNAVKHDPPESAEALEHSAAELLSESGGPHAHGLVVKAQADGRITVYGTIPSYEEKLGISRALRRLRGCLCVENDVVVPLLQRDGRYYTQLGSDGQHLLVVASPAAEGPGPRVAALGGQAVVSAASRSGSAPSEAMPLPSPKPPMPVLPEKTVTTSAPAFVRPLTGPAAPPRAEVRPAPAGIAPPVTTQEAVTLAPAHPATHGEPVAFLPWLADEAPAPAAKPKTSAAPFERTSPPPAPLLLNAGSMNALPSVPASALPHCEVPGVTADRPDACTQRILPPTLPAVTLPPSGSEAHRPTPMGTKPVKDPSASASPMTLGDVTVPAFVRSSAPTPRQSAVVSNSSTMPPAKGPVAPPIRSGVSYQTTGTISFAEDEPPPAHASTKLTAPLLKQHVETVCGRQGHDVRVSSKADTDWEITFKASNSQDAREVWAKIKEMPELASYHVVIRVEVGH